MEGGKPENTEKNPRSMEETTYNNSAHMIEFQVFFANQHKAMPLKFSGERQHANHISHPSSMTRLICPMDSVFHFIKHACSVQSSIAKIMHYIVVLKTSPRNFHKFPGRVDYITIIIAQCLLTVMFLLIKFSFWCLTWQFWFVILDWDDREQFLQVYPPLWSWRSCKRAVWKDSLGRYGNIWWSFLLWFCVYDVKQFKRRYVL